MTTLNDRFKALASENAPGQEGRKKADDIESIMLGEKLEGIKVDFSHGDIDAFEPTPGAFEAWVDGYKRGGAQAYTQYRGDADIRKGLAKRLGTFTGCKILADEEIIITPGTQGALFLVLGATVESGEKIAVIEPDYFANRKLVKYFGGVIAPVALHYQNSDDKHGIDINQLEKAFKDGAKTLVFSNPNNPTGLVYSKETIENIASLSSKYGVTVIADQLYSRLLYSGENYTHLCACKNAPENLITIIGPSKTESLSGFRLGVAIGSSWLVERMEKLQAIVSLRAAGYNQAVLEGWLDEPDGWLKNRIKAHEKIRDDLISIFKDAGLSVATPQAGSYLFPKLPPLVVSPLEFVQLLRHQANVIVTIGSEFGPTTKESIRLNFSQDHDNAVAAAKRIVSMIERYKK